MFLHLTGEDAQVTGAQLSRRAHERPVEIASVMLRSADRVPSSTRVLRQSCHWLYERKCAC